MLLSFFLDDGQEWHGMKKDEDVTLLIQVKLKSY